MKLDENDRLRAGTLPTHPREGLALVRPDNGEKVEPLAALPIAESLAHPHEPIEEVARNILHRPSIAIIGGSKGCGKSTLAQQFALDLALGRALLGEFHVARPYRVLYIGLEHPPALIEQTWQELITGSNGAVPESLFVRYRDEKPRLDLFADPSSLARLHATIEALKIEVLILDTLSKIHSADENTVADMVRVMDALEELRDRHRLLVVLVHHTRKATAGGDLAEGFERVRGSGAIIAAAETVLSIDADGENRKLTLRSNIPGVVPNVGLTYTRDAEAGSIVLRSTPFMELFMRIVKAVREGAHSRNEIAVAVGVDPQDGGFRRALQRAVGSKEILEDKTRKPYAYLPAGAQGTAEDRKNGASPVWCPPISGHHYSAAHQVPTPEKGTSPALPLPVEMVKARIAELVKLEPLDYAQRKKAEAKALGLTAADLDRAMKEARKELAAEAEAKEKAMRKPKRKKSEAVKRS